MSDLARLVVKLTAQTAEYEKKLDQANAKLSRFQRTTDNQLKQITRSFGSFNRALGAIGVGVSFVAITRGLAGAAQKAIEYGDSINKAAVRTGVGAQAFSELAFAAKQNDIELDSLTNSFAKLQKVISEAGSGSKSALQAFSALGIEFEQLRALAPDKQFELIAEQISRVRDPADKARAAIELFGRSGAELLPLFEQGAEGIRKAREEAQRLGASLTEEQVKALAEADDAIKRLGQSWDGFARTLTANVAPNLTLVFDVMSNGLAQNERKTITLTQAWEALGRAVDKNGFFTSPLDVVREIQAGDQANRTSTGTRLPPGGRNRRPTPIDYTVPADAKPKSPRSTGMSAAEREAAEALERQAKAYEDIYSAGIQAIEGLRTPVESQIAQYQEQKYALEQLAATYPNLADQAAAALARLEMEGLEPITITAERIFPEKEQEQLSVFFEEASRSVQGILADFIFDPFEDGIKGLGDSFVQLLQRMAAEAVAAQIAEKIFGAGGTGSGGGWLGALGGILGGIGGGGGNMSGLSEIAVTAARIPGFADGGFLRPGQIGMVGERGPELAFGGRSGMTIAPMEKGGQQITNHFMIQAPDGRVSRSTELQIAAAAARGAQRANLRNN